MVNGKNTRIYFTILYFWMFGLLILLAAYLFSPSSLLSKFYFFQISEIGVSEKTFDFSMGKPLTQPQGMNWLVWASHINPFLVTSDWSRDKHGILFCPVIYKGNSAGCFLGVWVCACVRMRADTLWNTSFPDEKTSKVKVSGPLFNYSISNLGGYTIAAILWSWGGAKDEKQTCKLQIIEGKRTWFLGDSIKLVH